LGPREELVGDVHFRPGAIHQVMIGPTNSPQPALNSLGQYIGAEIMIVPRSKRIVTPGSMGLRVILQLRAAWAASLEPKNVRLKTVLLSTGVNGVWSIALEIFVGAVELFAGFSNSAKIAFKLLRFLSKKRAYLYPEEGIWATSRAYENRRAIRKRGSLHIKQCPATEGGIQDPVSQWHI